MKCILILFAGERTPLIYKAIPTWFVNVEKIRDRMVELNQSTHWVPGFIGEKDSLIGLVMPEIGRKS